MLFDQYGAPSGLPQQLLLTQKKLVMSSLDFCGFDSDNASTVQSSKAWPANHIVGIECDADLYSCVICGKVCPIHGLSTQSVGQAWIML